MQRRAPPKKRKEQGEHQCGHRESKRPPNVQVVAIEDVETNDPKDEEKEGAVLFGLCAVRVVDHHTAAKPSLHRVVCDHLHLQESTGREHDETASTPGGNRLVSPDGCRREGRAKGSKQQGWTSVPAPGFQDKTGMPPGHHETGQRQGKASGHVHRVRPSVRTRRSPCTYTSRVDTKTQWSGER